MAWCFVKRSPNTFQNWPKMTTNLQNCIKLKALNIQCMYLHMYVDGILKYFFCTTFWRTSFLGKASFVQVSERLLCSNFLSNMLVSWRNDGRGTKIVNSNQRKEAKNVAGETKLSRGHFSKLDPRVQLWPQGMTLAPRGELWSLRVMLAPSGKWNFFKFTPRDQLYKVRKS
jgi:hypothetical protein